MDINISKMEKARRFYYLSQSNSFRQADIIADHYASLAQIAMQLKQAVEARKLGGLYSPNPGIDELITYLTEQIKTQHCLAFGIELNWNTESPEDEVQS